ncbi:hypothetical protein BASA62_000477 [Batrachochytrium salamandrivorans]|nr:hypothetical protein BASA62_000477 [Batrachochytrium salamandrivorans]
MDDDDSVDHQASGSKDVTSLPLRVYPTTLPTTLQESNTLDQSDASSSVDRQPGKDCKGGYRIRRVSKSCPQQQSPPGSLSSTLHVLPQSYEMSLPVYLGELEVKSYRPHQNTDHYNAFIASEIRYFESEYSRKRKLGEGSFGKVYLATRKSDGMQVAYKSITKSDEYGYALEPSPPPICHLPTPLVPSEEASVEQYMSSRPPNLLLPYEFLLQMYLSQPGHENPYAPNTFDYIILKKKYILVMEYFDEDWVNLAKYVKRKKRLDIETTRDIIKKIVEAMIFLKQYGILHDDIHGVTWDSSNWLKYISDGKYDTND